MGRIGTQININKINENTLFNKIREGKMKRYSLVEYHLLVKAAKKKRKKKKKRNEKLHSEQQNRYDNKIVLTE